MPIPISNDLFRDFLQCKYKAFLKISGKCGQKSDYGSSKFNCRKTTAALPPITFSDHTKLQNLPKSNRPAHGTSA